jgi:peptidoglycan/LPS O-acetylase OafA/YrhL
VAGTTALPAPAPARTSRSYRPELDGVRAFAVIGVMLFHAAPTMPKLLRVNGGFQGVDVFFALSGYLITSLLLREYREHDRIDLRAFYGRRALRILPPLTLLVAICFVVAYHLHGNVGHRSMLEASLLAFTFIGNWFEAMKPLGLLTHTWSLAIEEQFYLVWPVVLFLLLRTKRSRRSIVGTLVALATLSIVARFSLLTHGHHALAMYSTFSRTDGILLGSGLALLLEHEGARARRFLAVPAIGFVSFAAIASFTVACGHVVSPTGCNAPVGSIFGTLLIGHLVAAPVGGLAAFLAIRPLRWTGRISYGLYLFHVPVLAWVFAGRHTPWDAALIFAGAFAIAVPSYFVVEKRFMRLYKARPVRLALAATPSVAVTP